MYRLNAWRRHARAMRARPASHRVRAIDRRALLSHDRHARGSQRRPTSAMSTHRDFDRRDARERIGGVENARAWSDDPREKPGLRAPTNMRGLGDVVRGTCPLRDGGGVACWAEAAGRRRFTPPPAFVSAAPSAISSAPSDGATKRGRGPRRHRESSSLVAGRARVVAYP